MAIAKDKMKPGTKSQVGLGLAFFLLCYVYVWLVVQPDLIYHGFGTLIGDVPVFSTGWQFLTDALDVPGGPVLYAWGFLSQWYYYSWLGALIIVLVASCLCELARRHCILAGQRSPVAVHYLPAVALLVIYNRYDHPLAACLTLSVGLALSYVFQRVALRRDPVRMMVFCLLVAVGYGLAGAGAALVFALLTTIYLAVLHRDWLRALLALPAAAGIVWLLAEYVFYIPPRRAFLDLTPFYEEWMTGMKTSSVVLVAALFAFVPVAVLLIGLWQVTLGTKKTAGTGRGNQPLRRKKRAAGESRQIFLARVKKLALPALPMVLAALGLYLSFDKTHRLIVRMNALSRQGRWSEVLELSERLPKDVYNIYCNHDINRALYEHGRLGYDMLCFPQTPHAFFLTHEQEMSCMTQLKMADAYMALGNVDLAEKQASEFLVTKGNFPVALEQLARASIVKGCNETARVYLNVLRKDPIHRAGAERLLDGLDQGFAATEAGRIRQLHSYIPKHGHGRLHKESIEEMLTGLLAHNRHNKMAFEYLMACYLLAGRLDGIVANVGHLHDLGYREMPTLYQEALLIYHGARQQRLNLKELNIKRETFERYKRFVQLNNAMEAGNRQTMFQQLLREFGTSYFFYYRFTIARPKAAS